MQMPSVSEYMRALTLCVVDLAMLDGLVEQVALPELTAGRDFTEPGKLSIKNGDVVIVTRSG